MTRVLRRVARRAQVLVFPWVTPGHLLAGLAVVSGLAAWTLSTPQPVADTYALGPNSGSVLRFTPTLGTPQTPGTPAIPVRLHAPPRALARGPMFQNGTLYTPCGGVVDATVLAHTLHMGARGPEIPIALGFAFDGEALPAHALGRGMSLGETRSVVVSKASRLSFVTAARYDRYGAMMDNVYVRSDLPGAFADSREPRAIVLVNGDRVPHAARVGYGAQPSLTRILGRMVDAGGRVVLPPNQAVLAYEYTSHFASPAADFQDLVLLVTFTSAR